MLLIVMAALAIDAGAPQESGWRFLEARGRHSFSFMEGPSPSTIWIRNRRARPDDDGTLSTRALVEVNCVDGSQLVLQEEFYRGDDLTDLLRTETPEPSWSTPHPDSPGGVAGQLHCERRARAAPI